VLNRWTVEQLSRKIIPAAATVQRCNGSTIQFLI